MSNYFVGKLYAKLVNDVMAAVVSDFEDHEVDQQTWLELKSLWQQNLSKTGVALFPWDPAQTHTDIVPQFDAGQSMSNLQSSPIPVPVVLPPSGAAALRAAQHIQALAREQGKDLNGFINLASEAASNLQALASRSQAKESVQQQESGNSSASSASVFPDGSYDLTDRKRKLDQSNESNTYLHSSYPRLDAKNSSSQQLAQHDGAIPGGSQSSKSEYDGDSSKSHSSDVDKDVINSDLDDSDSDSDVDPDLQHEGLEASGQNIVLCQYEKVQRVKNKWKCVFRNGIIGINGRDYVFSKGNGEFEW